MRLFLILVALLSAANYAHTIVDRRVIKPLDLDYGCIGPNAPSYFGFPRGGAARKDLLVDVDSVTVSVPSGQGKQFVIQEDESAQHAALLQLQVYGYLKADIVVDTKPIKIPGTIKSKKTVFKSAVASVQVGEGSADDNDSALTSGTQSYLSASKVSAGSANENKELILMPGCDLVAGGCPIQKNHFYTFKTQVEAGAGKFLDFGDSDALWVYFDAFLQTITVPDHSIGVPDQIAFCVGVKLSKKSVFA
ncbi:hypothetical protein MIR68_007560 [Amoeboaphelidium protococcarum]|nr:hypothetical protein MIR68_007560 [Amoeboaphelidium protococcarum]